jgi:phospholipase C/sugar lactone lactonase YvrE
VVCLCVLFIFASIFKSTLSAIPAEASVREHSLFQGSQTASSSVVVSSLETNLYPNQCATLVATVSVASGGPALTGNVTFMLGAASLTTASLTPIDQSDSMATFTVAGSALPTGPNSISAVYSGDSNYSGSSGAITITSLSPQVNFGTSPVGTAATQQTLLYQFSATTTLSGVQILTAGVSALDYSDGGSSSCRLSTPYSAGQSCIFNVAFTPSAPGARPGAVTLFAQGTNLPLMTWYLSGLGQSSAVTIDPGTQSTIGTLNNTGKGYGSAVDGAGNVYVADSANNQIIELAAGTFAQTTMVSSGLLNPTAVALDGAGNLYISDSGHNQVVIVPDENGTLNSSDMSPVSIAGLGSPSGIAVDASGNLYVADSQNGDLLLVPTGGGAPLTLAMNLVNPRGIAVDASGNVYVTSDGMVAEYPSGGSGVPTPIGTGYNTPSSVAIDASGTVYVADTGNAQIVEIPAGNATRTNFPMTGLATPRGIALDASANVYVTDGANMYQVNRTLTPPLNFSAAVGSTSLPQTLTVSNVGNQTLNISTIAIPQSFVQATSGGTACAAGAMSSAGQCFLVLEFSPSVGGSVAGALVLSDNALNNASASQSVSLSGNPALLTQAITFTPLTTTVFNYGASPFTLSGAATSSLPVTFRVVTGPATVSGNTVTITGAGSVTLEADQSGSPQFAAAPPVQQTFTVNKVMLTVTPQSASMPYGGPIPILGANITGFVNGDNPSVLTGLPTLTTAATVTSPVGSYSVTVAQGTLASPNYNFTVANTSVSLTVTQAILTATANNLSTLYGSTLPSLTYTLVGLKNADSQASTTTGKPTLATTATKGVSIGVYPITISQGTLTLKSANYSLTLASGVLTVNPVVLKVVANSTSIQYGTAIPTLHYGISGLVNGNQLSVVSGAPTIMTTAVKGSGVGAYPIILGQGTLSAANYTFSFTNSTLTIIAVALNVTAGNAAITYGGNLPSFTFTIAGFQNGDTRSIVTGVPSYTTTAPGNMPVGTWAIVPATGTLSTTPNYFFRFTNGVLTIKKSILTVVATNASVPFNQPIPTLAATITGFVNNDTESVVIGAAALSTTATQGSSIGNYVITASLGTLSAANYNFSFVNGFLMITSDNPSAYSLVFQHVIVIVQENRTPDNLFQGLPGADIATSGINSHGLTIPLTKVPLEVTYGLDHTHAAFMDMYDGGKMDGADKVQAGCTVAKVPNCPPPDPQFAYVDPADIQPYLQLAGTYTFGDRMFQTNQGPSFPAHQFIIAGTSAPTATSDMFAAENPNGAAGCTAPSNSSVLLIDPTGKESQSTYPCFEHPTLMDLLDAQTITWRYYAPSISSIWTGPNAIDHIRTGADWSNIIVPQTKVLTDIAAGHLAQMSWVIPTGQDSDHPGSTGGSGPSWVASIVNAIGNSPYWSNTAIVITWDDWGGWYDHVAPPMFNSYEYGFRVPLIIVSPYSKQAYVSHVTHDFGSILHFTEEVFNLPSLGYADSRADDFSDCFDLTQTPIAFQTVSTALDQKFFLNSNRPAMPPDDDDDEK